MTPAHVRAGAWLYTRRTLTHRRQPNGGPFRGARYIARNALGVVRADRPNPAGPARRLAAAIPWWSTLVVPGALIVKLLAIASSWLVWLVVTIAITIPIAALLAVGLTTVDWLIIRPTVLALIANGWTPPHSFADSIEEHLLDATRSGPPPASKPRPSGTAHHDEPELLLDPLRADLEAQALVHEKAAEANRLGLELLRQQHQHTSASPASLAQAPVVVDDRRRQPLKGAGRGLTLAVWLFAAALTTGGCLAVIGLTIGSTTDVGPEPPTSSELVDHIDSRHADRQHDVRQRFCRQHPNVLGCSDPATNEAAE